MQHHQVFEPRYQAGRGTLCINMLLTNGYIVLDILHQHVTTNTILQSPKVEKPEYSEYTAAPGVPGWQADLMHYML